jgi:hypothetical protein
LDDSISFLEDLLAPIAEPVQAVSAHQVELNTPTTGEFRVA